MKWSPCYTSLADQKVSLPRFGHSAVAVNCPTSADVEGGTDLVVVYGGVGLQAGESVQTALGDVIALQVDNATWFAPDIVPGSSPGARAFHAAVAIGRKVLIFGGHILCFDQEHNRKRRNFYNDVWELDTDSWQWTKVSVDPSGPCPPGRDMACLLQLNNTQLLLFGGRSETGKALQDSWLFDINMCSWRHLTPEGPLPPSRKMHSMVKVGANQVVLFGGERDNGPLDDLWIFRGWAPGSMEPLRWTQVKMKVSPAPRFGHAMVSVSRTSVQPSTASVTGEADNSNEEEPAAAATVAGEDTAAAISSSRSEGGASESAFSVSTSIAAAAAASEDKVLLFGGCLDLSSFLSLARNYVQSKETWLLDLNMLTWLPVSAGGGPDQAPCERMCHSLTPLSDGRLLLLGGRHKEGICKDLWWLDTTELSTSSRTSTAGSLLPQTSTASQQAAGSRSGSHQSLFQTLLGPIRARESSQGQVSPAAEKPAVHTAPTVQSAVSQDASSMQPPLTSAQPQQQVPSVEDPMQVQSTQTASPAGALPQDMTSSQPQQGSQQQQLAPPLSAADIQATPAAVDGSVPVQATVLSSAAPPVTATAAGLGSINQPLAALMDVSSGEFAKLIRNPAAYSADAINKLSNSVSNTMTSLLAQGQQGPLASAIPAALSRVTPTLRANTPNSIVGNSSSLRSRSYEAQSSAGMLALRAQLDLPAESGQISNPSSAPFMPPDSVLQKLAALGQQLLGVDSGSDGGNSSSSGDHLPPDVLVSAARQHLMSAAVAQLHLPQVELLLADYQHLAADECERQLLSRFSEGASAAAVHAQGYSFMHRQPFEVMVGQVQQLQAEYRQLLVDAA